MQNNNKKSVLIKTTPYNAEAEIYVLGSVIIDNRIMGLLAGKIYPNDFYDERNQQIFTTKTTSNNANRSIFIQLFW